MNFWEWPPHESLFFSSHCLSCSSGCQPLLSAAHSSRSSPLSHPSTSCCQNESPKTPIWFKSILCFSIGYRLKSKHNVFSGPFTATSFQRFSKQNISHLSLHFLTSLKSACALKCLAAMWWGWYGCHCLRTHNRICRMGVSNLEETPGTTAEHSFKKHRIFRSLGATEDHTLLNAQVTQDPESEDAWGILQSIYFSILFLPAYA